VFRTFFFFSHTFLLAFNGFENTSQDATQFAQTFVATRFQDIAENFFRCNTLERIVEDALHVFTKRLVDELTRRTVPNSSRNDAIQQAVPHFLTLYEFIRVATET